MIKCPFCELALAKHTISFVLCSTKTPLFLPAQKKEKRWVLPLILSSCFCSESISHFHSACLWFWSFSLPVRPPWSEPCPARLILKWHTDNWHRPHGTARSNTTAAASRHVRVFGWLAFSLICTQHYHKCMPSGSKRGPSFVKQETIFAFDMRAALLCSFRLKAKRGACETSPRPHSFSLCCVCLCFSARLTLWLWVRAGEAPQGAGLGGGRAGFFRKPLDSLPLPGPRCHGNLPGLLLSRFTVAFLGSYYWRQIIGGRFGVLKGKRFGSDGRRLSRWLIGTFSFCWIRLLARLSGSTHFR